MADDREENPENQAVNFLLFLLKLAVFLGGLAVFGLAVYWLRRTLS